LIHSFQESGLVVEAHLIETTARPDMGKIDRRRNAVDGKGLDGTANQRRDRFGRKALVAV